MQNYLKYGKLSEMCGINGYFAGNIRKKSRLRRQGNSHIIFKERGKRIQLLVRIYSPVTASFTLTTPPPLRFLGRINGFPFLKQTIYLTKIYDFVLIRIMKIISILISFLWIESCFIPLFMQISIFQFAKSWCLLEIYICIWKYKIH